MVYNVTHCYFENIQQTSTSFGGTIDINWKFNSTKDLHGSHKFFSRQSGSKIKILYNRIDTINGAIGIEFGQQNEVIISGNIIDGAGIGIRGYNNGDANNPVMIYNNPYDITITENILLNCKTHGIYIDSLGATDNTYNTLNNLKINGNIIRNLNPLNIAQTDINVDFSAIYLKSKTITNLEIKFNTLDSINGTAVQLYGTVYNMIDIESNVMSNLLRTILALYVYNESGAVCKNISIKNNHGTMGKELIKYNAFGGATQIDSFIIEGNNLTLENLNSLTFNNSRIANNNFVCSKSDTAFSWVYWNLVNSYLENNIFNAPNVQYALHGVFTSAKLFHNVFIGTLSTALSNAIKINDSTAVDVATLKTDFNNLLAKLRTLNLIG
jgi:hypothetical protein